MFNFGQQYVQLGAEGSRAPKDAAKGSAGWAPAQGDVEGASARPAVAAPVAAPVASTASGRTESGRVQVRLRLIVKLENVDDLAIPMANAACP